MPHSSGMNYHQSTGTTDNSDWGKDTVYVTLQRRAGTGCESRCRSRQPTSLVRKIGEVFLGSRHFFSLFPDRSRSGINSRPNKTKFPSVCLSVSLSQIFLSLLSSLKSTRLHLIPDCWKNKTKTKTSNNNINNNKKTPPPKQTNKQKQNNNNKKQINKQNERIWIHRLLLMSCHAQGCIS